MLQWFGYVERMEEEHLVKKITRSDTKGIRPRRRPRMGWLDSVNRVLGASKEEWLCMTEMNEE